MSIGIYALFEVCHIGGSSEPSLRHCCITVAIEGRQDIPDEGTLTAQYLNAEGETVEWILEKIEKLAMLDQSTELPLEIFTVSSRQPFHYSWEANILSLDSD